ncbi:MAG: ParM/StbA family protein [Gammaproteobacteria bacterium]|nr:ParM/StbA family protein [Gammaproteobacteria bacterium]
MSVVGIDIGFGFTKACNGRNALIFKSIFGEATEIQYREQILGSVPKGDHLQIELDGKSYFVGELAERQSNVRSFTLDQDQLIGSFARIMAVTALSQLAGKNEQVRVVTGLPISYYRRHKEELTRILTGKHDAVLVDSNGQRNEVSVQVTHTRVIPQPFGTLFGHMLNDLAEIGNRRFAQEKIGIIDVGFRTSDYSISDRTRYSERGSQTTDTGIARAFAHIAARLRELTGVNVELYRLYDAVSRASIKIRGKNIDLRPVVEEAFTKLASTIATEVERLWADDWDIDLIVITGGGGAVLSPYLKQQIHGELMELDSGSDARLANVRGYWRYGMHLLNKEQQREPAPPRPNNVRAARG